VKPETPRRPGRILRGVYVNQIPPELHAQDAVGIGHVRVTVCNIFATEALEIFASPDWREPAHLFHRCTGPTRRVEEGHASAGEAFGMDLQSAVAAFPDLWIAAVEPGALTAAYLRRQRLVVILEIYYRHIAVLQRVDWASHWERWGARRSS